MIGTGVVFGVTQAQRFAPTVDTRVATAHQIAEQVASDLGGLEASELDWLKKVFRCFPSPTAGEAPSIVGALVRIFDAVPWASELPVDSEDFVRHLSSLGPRVSMLSEVFPARYAVSADNLLTALRGDFLPSRFLFDTGRAFGPAKHAEALRLALIFCQWRWLDSDRPCTTALEVLGRTLRGLDKSSFDQRMLLRIGKAGTLLEFIDVTSEFKERGPPDLGDAWARHFEPELLEIPRLIPSVTPTPKPSPGILDPSDPWLSRGPRGSGARRRPSKNRDSPADSLIERILKGVRRGHGPRPDEADRPQPGESPFELDSPLYIAPLPEAPTNKDARAVLARQVRQTIWNSNHLLLTNHSQVLVWPEYVRVIGALLGMLRESESDQLVRWAALALLLQALTGRTLRALQSLVIVEHSGATVDPRLTQIRVAEGVIRLPCFWQIDESSGPEKGPSYFRPQPNQALLLESVRSDFHLLMAPEIVEVLSLNLESLRSCLGAPSDELVQAMRDVASDVADRENLTFTIGQLRSSFAVHLFEQCGDVATTQLICADTLGQSTAPLAYFAPRVHDLAQCFWTFQCRVLGVERPMPRYPRGEDRIGSHLLVTPQTACALARSSSNVLRHGLNRLLDESRISDIHQALVTHTVCMLMAVATHRPSEALLGLKISDFLLGNERGAALFRDKIHDGAHDPRIVALPRTVVRQIGAYLSHLAGLAARLPHLASPVRKILKGGAPLFFGLTSDGQSVKLDLRGFKAMLPANWRALPQNWGRHWMRTYALEAGIRPELTSLQLGHLEAVGYPFSGASPTEPWQFVNVVADDWDRLAREQGWEVVRGLKAVVPDEDLLPPLRLWAVAVSTHSNRQRQIAKTWRQAMKARLRGYRERASAIALHHPELVGAGISSRFCNQQSVLPAHLLKRIDFERIRDDVYTAAEDDLALAIACANAVCDIARAVNRRTGQVAETPGKVMALRRPHDNAFIPGMMTGVRQIIALRNHVALLAPRRGGGLAEDFPTVCARAALALVLFGYCEIPEQVLGAISHRSKLIRSSVLQDVILVPWGLGSHQVLGLRGVAAIVIGKVARKFPTQSMPSRLEIEASLADLLPDWSKTERKSQCAKGDGLLDRLCETAAIAARYELSPAARIANAPSGGSTPAHIQEQVAFIDGDPAGSLIRSWESEGKADQALRSPESPGIRKGNARSQYLGLCRVFPSSDRITLMPLTDEVIKSGQIASPESRRRIVAEAEAQLALSDPATRLQPIVRVLVGWVIDLLVNGTPQRSTPALSTVETYLTRIGGVLVHIFGQSSLDTLDEVELEEAYLTVIEGKREDGSDVRQKAASVILMFHSYAEAHAGFPEMDLSSVRIYLGEARDALADARLVLPAERDASMVWLRNKAIGNEAVGALSDARLIRQAALVMPFFGLCGLRRSEPLGLQFRDVRSSDEMVVASLRPNSSRRLKTINSRRSVRLPSHLVSVGGMSLTEWAVADRRRIGQKRLERAFIFTGEAEPFSAAHRSRIAKICVDALRKTTGRSQPRLHALRHLVGMERTTSVFLTPEDRIGLVTSMDVESSSVIKGGLAMPRDLARQVIELGHGNPRTTLLHYHHAPFLLRSRSDARLAAQYVNRTTLAPLLGLTIHALDWAVKQHKGRERGLVWLDVAVRIRSQPSPSPHRGHSLDESEDDTTASTSLNGWTAVELGALLDDVGRVGDLAKVLLLCGAPAATAMTLRRAFIPMERRLGRRLLGEAGRSKAKGTPRRSLRPLTASRSLEVLWTWFDQNEAGRRAILESIATDFYEHLDPIQGDRIYLPSKSAAELRRLLETIPLSPAQIWSELDEHGLSVLRVLRPQKGKGDQATGDKEQYLGLSLKRILLVIRAVRSSR